MDARPILGLYREPAAGSLTKRSRPGLARMPGHVDPAAGEAPAPAARLPPRHRRDRGRRARPGLARGRDGARVHAAHVRLADDQREREPRRAPRLRRLVRPRGARRGRLLRPHARGTGRHAGPHQVVADRLVARAAGARRPAGAGDVAGDLTVRAPRQRRPAQRPRYGLRMCEHQFVRWDNLKVETEESRTLPGYREPAAIRTFDAPEAMNVRFYEVKAKSILNRVPKASRMPFRWTINPYRGCAHACVYCFARPTHTYLDFNARDDFEREIVVKVNVPELVRKELGKPSWKGDHVALGTNTDPYQWVEGRYKLMQGIWEAMRDYSNPCSVLTKSPLLLRDLELMKQLVEVTEFAANLSVPTLDEKAWRETEPHTPHPRKRLEAAGELNRAGIPTGVLIAPLMPGI